MVPSTLVAVTFLAILQTAQGQGSPDDERIHDKIMQINRQAGLLDILFEGDIKLNAEQRTLLTSATGRIDPTIGRKKRDVIRIPPVKFWDKRVELPSIPYAMSADMQSKIETDDAFRSMFTQANGEFLSTDEGANIHKKYNYSMFRPRGNGDADYVEFVRKPGCWSYVGRQGGRQELSLGPGCEAVGIFKHLMLHTMGLWHEHTRTDRDDFLLIHKENVLPGKEWFFMTYDRPWLQDESTDDEYDLSYDLCSLLHIGPLAFSRNGKGTNYPYTGSLNCFVATVNLTEKDLSKLAFLYGFPPNCFPMDTEVYMENGEARRLADLRIGDRVLALDQAGRLVYTDVYQFLHVNRSSNFLYREITVMGSNSPIRISHKHLIYLQDQENINARVVFAEDVVLSDTLLTFNSENKTFVPRKVVSIFDTVAYGAIAPLTLEGTIVVNGHLASTYGYLPNHGMLHRVFAPFRTYYRLSSAIFQPKIEAPPDGIHWSAMLLSQIACYLSYESVCDMNI